MILTKLTLNIKNHFFKQLKNIQFSKVIRVQRKQLNLLEEIFFLISDFFKFLNLLEPLK